MRVAEWVIFAMILLFFTILVPDIIVYATTVQKASQIADYATERMAVEGGWSEEIEDDVQEQMRFRNMDPAAWDVIHTEGQVSNPGSVTFGMATTYRISAFDILGEPVVNMMGDSLKLPIRVVKQKTSQVYIR